MTTLIVLLLCSIDEITMFSMVEINLDRSKISMENQSTRRFYGFETMQRNGYRSG